MPETLILPRPPRAVVFDMDGLLLDTEVIYRTAHTAAAEELGYAMTHALYATLVGMPRETADRLLQAAFGPGLVLADYYVSFDQHFETLCRDGMPLRPGVEALLAVLDEAGLPRAVATSTERSRARRHLEEAGILHRFDAVVTRSDVSQGKPHPETFLRAAEALAVAPSACLALEDSHNGVRAASAAGMMTIMVPDLLPATEETRRLCVAECTSLFAVAEALSCRAGTNSG